MNINQNINIELWETVLTAPLGDVWNRGGRNGQDRSLHLRFVNFTFLNICIIMNKNNKLYSIIHHNVVKWLHIGIEDGIHQRIK
jgi:hypothetical protein